jgi:hypothetical protein
MNRKKMERSIKIHNLWLKSLIEGRKNARKNPKWLIIHNIKSRIHLEKR